MGLMPVNELVSTKISEERVVNQSRVNKSNEVRSMRPLPFIPKTNKPKKSLRINRENEILKTIRTRNNIQK